MGFFILGCIVGFIKGHILGCIVGYVMDYLVEVV